METIKIGIFNRNEKFSMPVIHLVLKKELLDFFQVCKKLTFQITLDTNIQVIKIQTKF